MVKSSDQGPVVQWLERTAHNGVVGGSNPSGPTISYFDLDLYRLACFLKNEFLL